MGVEILHGGEFLGVKDEELTLGAEESYRRYLLTC